MEKTPWEHPNPPVLYKYLGPDRLDALTDCHLRFTQRNFFKDDHELQPDYDAFGTLDEIKRQMPTLRTPIPSWLPRDVVARIFAHSPRHQKSAIENALKNIKSLDELGILCLTVDPDSERMWDEYGFRDAGFVVAFETTHVGFKNLTTPRGVGKVTYSGEGIPTFLGMMESRPYELLFRKRMEYAFEQEWRSFRLLKDLERFSEQVFLSSFDPACVREIVIGRNCPVESNLRALAVSDSRYQHVRVAKR